MKVKAKVMCSFEVEYEDYNDDIKDTETNIRMSNVQELIELETDDSIQIINVVDIQKVK